jgi:hypothetical protein
MSSISTSIKKLKMIVTSGKYSDILPLFAKQFNKYFSPDVEVIVLSPNQVTGLPDNFSYHKIPFTQYWCNDIREFFDSFEDEIFFGCMEDHFLHSPVDLGFLAEILECFNDESIIKYCSVKPGDWLSQIRDRPSTRTVTHNGEKYGVYKEDLFFNAPVRQSLLPSIWRTSFFKLMLENSKDFNAWEFEARRNEYRLEQNILDQINDKKILFSTKQLFPMSDVIRGGQPAVGYWSQEVKNPEDIAVFREATERVFPNVLWTT